MDQPIKTTSIDRKRERFVRKGKSAFALKSLETTQKEADQALETAKATGGEGLEVATIRKDIADKDLELFFHQRDSTGALKRDQFWRDTKSELHRRGWERDAEGRIPITEEDERTHVLMVNMGELDRLNAIGDHSFGDKGLRLTAERIESVVREVLGDRPEFKDERRLAGAYDLYRFSGNDFTVNLRGVDPDDADEILRRISQDTLTVVEGKDPVPLVGSLVSRADGIALLNGVEPTPEQAGITVEKAMTDAMLEKLQALNDVIKLEDRAVRMSDRILMAEAGALKEEDVKTHYEQFLMKSLGAAFKEPEAAESMGYEAFKALVKAQRPSLDTALPTRWTHTVSERSMDGALGMLQTRRAIGRSIEQALARNVAEQVLKRKAVFETTIGSVEGPETPSEFKNLGDTRGTDAIRDAEQEATEAGKARGQGPVTEAKADLADLEYRIELAKRDERTGLGQRGMYFDAVENAFRESKPVSTVMIDMAFLNYFDKAGSPATGDLAIKTVAKLLDIVAERYSAQGVTVEAYRIGGDEFSLSVIGGDEKTVEKILTELGKLARGVGRIPGQEGARATYRPERVQFNYGMRTATDAESFRKELTEAGVVLTETGTAFEQNELAGYLHRLADKESEIHKGVSRMIFLMNRLVSAGGTEDEQMKALFEYSTKATFDGRDQIRAFAKRLMESKDPDNEMKRIRGDVLRYIIDAIDARNRKDAAFGVSLDRRLEDRVRIRYFERRIEELKKEIGDLHAQIKLEKEENDHLKRAVAAAEAEKQAIVELQGRIVGGPPSIKPPPALQKAA